MTENERLALASRLYVRLRHSAGRITDAVWMIENAAYTREVLKLARQSTDAELQRLADRFEWIMFGGKPVAKNGSAAPAVAPSLNGDAREEEERYTGSLR